MAFTFDTLRRLTFGSLFLALSYGMASFAQADSSTSRDRAIPCPSIVADKRSGTLYSNRLPKSRYPFKCYREAPDAVRSGFSTEKAAQLNNFSGWYRVSLNTIRDTCYQSPPGVGPTLFLQVIEKNSAVFGAFCPLIGEYSGVRSGSSLTVSGIEETQEDPVRSICSDGAIKVQQFVHLSRAVEGAAAYSVTYKVLHTCTSPALSALSCVREYSGTAFLETHPIWPPVADNYSELTLGCGAALTTCVDCHDSLKSLPPLKP